MSDKFDLEEESWLWDEAGDTRSDAPPTEDEPAAPAPAAQPQPAAVVAPLPPWEQTYSDAGSDAGGGDSGGGDVDPPAVGGRFVPPTPVVRAQPRDNGLGALGIGLGAVGLLLGLFFHYALLLIVSLGVGACLCGWKALRHSVNTGAPGMNRAIAALVLGVLTFVGLGVSLTMTGREIQESQESVRGVFGGLGAAMDDMQRTAEIDGLALPGTGEATVTLEGVTFEIPLEGCGFSDPVPGYHLVGRGSTSEGRAVGLHFASVFLGVQGEAVSVTVGAQTYLLEGDQLFEVDTDAGTVSAAGTFSVPLSSTQAEGTLVASCSA